MLVSTTRDWGNIVRDRRMELGMSQEALAEQIGKARQWVVRFESGHAQSASLGSLVKVLEVLGLDAQVDVARDVEDTAPMFLDIDFPDRFKR